MAVNSFKFRELRLNRAQAESIQIGRGDQSKIEDKVQQIKEGTNTKQGKVLQYFKVSTLLSNVCSSIRKSLLDMTSQATKTVRLNISSQFSTVSTGQTYLSSAKTLIKTMVSTSVKFIKASIMPEITRSVYNNYTGREACKSLHTSMAKSHASTFSRKDLNTTKEMFSNSLKFIAIGGTDSQYDKQEQFLEGKQDKSYIMDAKNTVDLIFHTEIEDEISVFTKLNSIVDQALLSIEGQSNDDAFNQAILDAETLINDLFTEQLDKINNAILAMQAETPPNSRQIKIKVKTKEKISKSKARLFNSFSKKSITSLVKESVLQTKSPINEALLSNMKNTQNSAASQGIAWGAFTMIAHTVTLGMTFFALPVLVQTTNNTAHTLQTTFRSLLTQETKVYSSSKASELSTQKDISKMNTKDLIFHQLSQLKDLAYPNSNEANLEIDSFSSPDMLIDNLNLTIIELSKAEQAISELSATDSNAQYSTCIDQKNRVLSKIEVLKSSLQKTFTSNEIKEKQRLRLKSKVVSNLNKLEPAKKEELKDFIHIMESVIDAKESITFAGKKTFSDSHTSSFWDRVLTFDDKVANENYLIENGLYANS